MNPYAVGAIIAVVLVVIVVSAVSALDQFVRADQVWDANDE